MNPNQPLTSEELQSASKINVVDKNGNTQTFGELVKGKRVVLIFIRHFWCINCQAYTYQFGKSIPPGSLPENTEVYIIGCGSSSPIPTYTQRTCSPYPIYTCPSLDLHKVFNFVNTLKGSKDVERKNGYMSDLGSGPSRTWTTINHGLSTNPFHAMESERGPNDQNGGEVIIEKDGTCSFIHRMQNTEDHTPLAKLADIIGAKYIPLSKEEKVFPPA